MQMSIACELVSITYVLVSIACVGEYNMCW